MDAQMFKYKVIDEMRTKIMKYVLIYRYVSFTLGVLLSLV
jgi:hypothetical protein